MSLYHEAASILTGSGSSPNAHAGGSFKSRVFGNKELKSPPAQVYALALESCKWSGVLKEVVENSGLLGVERKLTPPLSILLTHDFLVSKSGIALPASHGLRQSIERHKARLTSEFTRARLRRNCTSLAELRSKIEHEYRTSCGITIHPRWIRVNTLKSTVDQQLESTFKGWEVLPSVSELLSSASSSSSSPTFSAAEKTEGKDNNRHQKICLDGNIPNLIAVSPLSGVDLTKTEAYKSGKIILQDKASCFPAYLLDPHPDSEAGDVIDACSAPGNKTTHLASILAERERSLLEPTKKGKGERRRTSKIFAFEKDRFRAKTLEKMVNIAGSEGFTIVNPGVDFLRVDPFDEKYKDVGALLLDPSCSGSGIVGRDVAPELFLPSPPSSSSAGKKGGGAGKRKRDPLDNGNNETTKKPSTLSQQDQQGSSSIPMEIIDDDGNSTTLQSSEDLKARISALATFQLSLLLHAFQFPRAKRITYSTCSIYAGENEHVVIAALHSEIAKQGGWKILKRADQVSGMREWDVRGSIEACEGFDGCGGEEAREIAEGCIRAYNRDDGRGVMGFFVAGFVRDTTLVENDGKEDDGGPYVRDDLGRIVRDENGIPTLKSTGGKAFEMDDNGESSAEVYGAESTTADDADGPFVRDQEGRIVRDAMGMPTLKEGPVLKKADIHEGEENKKGKKKKKKNNKKKGKGNGGKKDEVEDDGAEDEWDGFGD
ncbi:S-adenosyl-L-methionine-dependent methyltransferase [Rhypophila sp. PSN 637]